MGAPGWSSPHACSNQNSVVSGLGAWLEAQSVYTGMAGMTIPDPSKSPQGLGAEEEHTHTRRQRGMTPQNNANINRNVKLGRNREADGFGREENFT